MRISIDNKGRGECLATIQDTTLLIAPYISFFNVDGIECVLDIKEGTSFTFDTSSGCPVKSRSVNNLLDEVQLRYVGSRGEYKYILYVPYNAVRIEKLDRSENRLYNGDFVQIKENYGIELHSLAQMGDVTFKLSGNLFVFSGRVRYAQKQPDDAYARMGRKISNIMGKRSIDLTSGEDMRRLLTYFKVQKKRDPKC